LTTPHGERPLRALAHLCGAQICFALLDAAGKRLAADMGIPGATRAGPAPKS